MKVFTTCFQCDPAAVAAEGSLFSVERVPEIGVISHTCRNGHVTETIVQQAKFEILSELAVRAIVDQYYRESILSFAGALERLYEFFAKAVWIKRGVANDQIAAAWVNVSSQSERQAGTFVSAYLLETGQSPSLLPQKLVKLRNDVVHNGFFPDRSQTLKFGKAVILVSEPIIKLLKSSNFEKTVGQMVHDIVRERREKYCGYGPVSTLCMSTLMSLSNAEAEPELESYIGTVERLWRDG